jgi:uncharacterized OB-fold protein
MNKPGRIKPPLGHDNAWWWEQAGEGKLTIQRCVSCQTLRHPPRPMCSECRSMKWDYIESTGRGTVNSFTVLHHTQFPGYDYPLTIILVDLDEGTRLTSQLVECDRGDVSFGMAVEMLIQEDEDGFKIPVFRPVMGGAS